MLNIQLSKQAEKFLKALSSKQQKQLALKLKELQNKGHCHDTKQLKRSLWYRVDVGEYRIIYDIEKQKLLIVFLIGKRNDDDVYKKLRRL